LVGAGLTDTQFLFGVLIPVFGLVDGKLNLEAMAPAPLFMADDDWRFAAIGAKLDPSTGLGPDETTPYARYPANFNHVTSLGNPFAPSEFELRWYRTRRAACAPEIVCESSQINLKPRRSYPSIFASAPAF
ncbi:MAG TPA: hypothetical protein VG324_22145, partial [Blastocatellia bacterium]|nr:hypothetical protein [Blastocatellia bacterium]